MKKFIFYPIIIVLLATVFSTGFFIGKGSQPSIEKILGLSGKEPTQTTTADFSLFWDAWRVIEKKYVDRENLDRQNMIYGAITGLVNSLDDPYSVFMEPVESKKFIDDMSGSFDGIGAEVGIRKGVLTVISPLEGNPAQKAGLRAGDRILKVDDTLTADLTLEKSVNLIRGQKGTPVRLMIDRNDWTEAKEITVVRDTIRIPILTWEFRENNIAYIKLYHFSENSADEFRNAANQILKSNPKGIVLDIRNNPGGYLESAVDVASWFLGKGEVVVIEDFGNGEQNEYRSSGYEKLSNIPTVVLINQGSASASEIVAGALRDGKGIKLIGEKSFGKGSVQQLEKLKGGSSIKITVAKWLTPAGKCINKEGISPDIEVKETQEDIDALRDPRLEKALELLR